MRSAFLRTARSVTGDAANRRLREVVCALAMVGLSAGCHDGWDWWKRDKSDPAVVEQLAKAEQARRALESELERRAESPAVKGTIGSIGWIEGGGAVRVRGYGLVVNLGRDGSAECPEPVRRMLLTEMRRRALGESSADLEAYQPEEILNSRDTAAVVVTGTLPPGSLRGERFDVVVEALPGTQTRSLEGGYLWRCELHTVPPGGGVLRLGRALAWAEGPVFVNPFATSEEAATRVNPRRGVIYSGGVAMQDRPLRLVLTTASYQMATAVATAINNRFPSQPRAADPTSPSMVVLRVPQEFRGEVGHWLAIVSHLYLPGAIAGANEQAAVLVERLKVSNALHEDIALALEGLGRGVLGRVASLYGDPRPHASFYAARTGMRMGDSAAVAVLARHALDTASPYREAAIDALGEARRYYQAAEVLRGLLDDSDVRIRVRAYRALRRRADRTIRSIPVGEPNFVLDVVTCSGPPLVVADLSEGQRLVLFGPDTPCVPPIYYDDPRGRFVLSAGSEAEALTVVVRTLSGRLAGRLEVPLKAADLAVALGAEPRRAADGTLEGAGAAYSRVVAAFARLCELGAIPAKFHFPTPGLAPYLPDRPAGRPETDLP